MAPPFPFKIIEHTIPAQHIREHPHGINGRQEAILQLAIKQYVPLDRPDPIPNNAVTIIGAHGTGIPKEVYEPLWEDLHAQLKKQAIPIRGIWIADVSNQGASGVLNEYIQGDNTHWFDHSRDLLHMTNHFRDEMPRPIIGIAHSMGCAQLIHLTTMHPRLLSTLILYEPVILDIPKAAKATPNRAPNPSLPAILRPDLWATRAKAEAYFARALRKWDPRARDRYIRYGLRSLPTRLYPETTDTSTPTPTPTTATDTNSTETTLATTKHHEAWSFSIPNLEPQSAGLGHLLLPDWDREVERPVMFSRPECLAAMRELPFVRPSVLWVFAERSYLSGVAAQERKMEVTGTGVGGSGGAKEGRVKKMVLEKGGHMLVVEEVGWKSDGEMVRSSEVGVAVMRMGRGVERGKL
ncbi:putative toxin biosynthesis protein [Aspergillus ellipticus CBS 707.79]|uniref:Putative toxin biosynthesis protein n=1 Tax=Aspergillus ellipticus CBS 707.79 TaxID=1448320 RepID=A0A319DDS7_9EURO|nr:putative toxin biosynthesis protein [Aspergillus ellipticus CBS 707.79]